MAKKSAKSISELVVFMTAYNFHKMTVKKRRWLKRKKGHISTQLKKHHIAAVFHGETVISQLGRMDFKANYDKLTQKTTMTFSKEEMDKECHNSIWTQMQWAFELKNEMATLFDNDILQPSFFFRLQPFRIILQETVMEVKSFAFLLTNGILCTAFSLFDCEKKKFVTEHDVCGRNHHFHLLAFDSISYDGHNWISIERSSISDIVMQNVVHFNLSAFGVDFSPEGFTYYHSMLIMSNDIDDYEEYAHDVIGADFLSMPLNNICPTEECKYFSQECFSIVSSYDKKDFEHLLYRHIALESLKLYYFVNLIVAYEQTTSLSKTYKQVLQLNILEHMLSTPILTIQAINNIKQMSSYAKLKEAMEYKITYLNAKKEEKKDKNATLLNLLLYILALVGAVGTVYDLAEEFKWLIPWGLVLVIIVFAIGGIWWLKREKE